MVFNYRFSNSSWIHFWVRVTYFAPGAGVPLVIGRDFLILVAIFTRNTGGSLALSRVARSRLLGAVAIVHDFTS